MSETHQLDAPQQAEAQPKRQQADRKPLPQWKVLLHNDDVNEIFFVVATILRIMPLNTNEAQKRTMEAHHSGVALLLMTHQERAELYREQFASRGLTVTIEPDTAG